MTYEDVKNQIEALLKKGTPIQSLVIPPTQQLEAYKKGGDVRHNLLSILRQEHYWKDKYQKRQIKEDEFNKRIEKLKEMWGGFTKAKEESSVWYQFKETIKQAEEDILSKFKKGVDIVKIIVPIAIGLGVYNLIMSLAPRR